MTPPILKNTTQAHQVDSEGYTTFSLLPQTICHDLLSLYRSSAYRDENSSKGFSTGLDQRDRSKSLACSSRILEYLSPFLKDHLEDYQAIISTFIVKNTGTHNITPIHQDWTFVDESSYRSYTLWCPLQDVTLDNGALGLLPKSHHILGESVRPSPCPPYVPVFSECMMDVFGYMDFLSLSAGEAVLFDHRCWHGAMPNMLPETRIAIGISLTHKSAQLHHHYLLPSTNQAAIFSVDQAFFYRYNNDSLRSLYEQHETPSGYEHVSSYDFKPPVLDTEELLCLLAKDYTANEEVVARLQAAFPTAETQAFPSHQRQEIKETLASEEDSYPSSLPLWKVYTPKNIYLEIKQRLYRKSETPVEKKEKAPTSQLQEIDLPHSSQKETIEATGAFYDAHHESFMSTYGSVIQAFRTKEINTLLDYELQSIGIKEGDIVLDAGCGVCGPALHFSKQVRCSLHAITISENQYEQAQQQIEKEEAKEIQLYLGDFHELPTLFGAEMFDRIYFLESFGHSMQKKELLSSCWKVLKPGGSVYIKDLFRRIAPPGLSQTQIDALISRINAGYCYSIAELEDVLQAARAQGYVIRLVKTLDIHPNQFEDLTISNHFQELTGVNQTEDWSTYVFPVDFMEILLYKPTEGDRAEKDKHFLQNMLRSNSYSLSDV